MDVKERKKRESNFTSTILGCCSCLDSGSGAPAEIFGGKGAKGRPLAPFPPKISAHSSQFSMFVKLASEKEKSY